jgi:ATP-binding cassette subfamily F protein 3
MKHCGSGKNELELRTLLGCFCFQEMMWKKKLKCSSGRKPGLLAKTIAGRPTSYCWMNPRITWIAFTYELLAEALNKYEQLYLVSHDITHFKNGQQNLGN